QKKAADTKAAAAREASESDARRKAELARLAQLAGAGEGSGSDERDASPSASYAGRIRAAVRPNIVFTDSVPGNPVAVVQVQTGPTGTILSRRIIKSSGVKAWDDAVLRALDRTEKLPSDNGRYWNPMELVFRRHD
ncbi:MAG: cell envelope integrity protein TolA, partial [Pseudomonadota bacterium]|nr:cell envelope integrity protein TolA [Pseudomonadota bacterium]